MKKKRRKKSRDGMFYLNAKKKKKKVHFILHVQNQTHRTVSGVIFGTGT